MSVIISIITKNSYSELGQIFLKAMQASLQVPYKTLIIVDDGNDSTLAVVRRFASEHGKELAFSRSRLYGYGRATRATARQTAIDIFVERFNDDWLLFLDDDVLLNDGWWEEAKRHLNSPKVGLIWGLTWETAATAERTKWLRRFGGDFRKGLIERFKVRGGTHDTMLRREAIRGIRIPPRLHVLEDAWIKWYVVCRGWEYRILERGVTHCNPGRFLKAGDLRMVAIESYRLGIERPSFITSVRKLARTTAGMPVYFLYYLVYHARTQELRTGLRTQFLRSKDAWLFRLFLVQASLKEKGFDSPCQAIENYLKGM